MPTEQPASPALAQHSGLREFTQHMHHGARIGTETVTDLIAACRAADIDVEQRGALTAVTIDLIRSALAKADAV